MSLGDWLLFVLAAGLAAAAFAVAVAGLIGRRPRWSVAIFRGALVLSFVFWLDHHVWLQRYLEFSGRAGPFAPDDSTYHIHGWLSPLLALVFLVAGLVFARRFPALTAFVPGVWALVYLRLVPEYLPIDLHAPRVWLLARSAAACAALAAYAFATDSSRRP